LKAKLNENAADTRELRDTLIGSLQEADSIVINAKEQYPKLRNKSLQSPPIFLEDFHLHFEEAIEGLKSSSSVAKYEEGGHATLKSVAYQASSKSAQPHIGAHTLPLLAIAVIDRIEKAIEAFTLAEENGSYFFDVEIQTTPSGAKVYYTRLKHPYESLPSSTNIPKVTLQYAFWTFLFEKEGCQTPPQVLDPYNQPNPKLTVHLNCHGPKK